MGNGTTASKKPVVCLVSDDDVLLLMGVRFFFERQFPESREMDYVRFQLLDIAERLDRGLSLHLRNQNEAQ